MGSKSNNPGALSFDPADSSGLVYGCKLCGNRFSDRMKAISHFGQKHGKPKIPVPCSVCGKEFQPGVGITSHLRSHLRKTEKDVASLVETPEQVYTQEYLEDLANRDRDAFYALALTFGVRPGKGVRVETMVKRILHHQNGEPFKPSVSTNGKKPHAPEDDDSVDSVVNRIAHKLLIDRLRELERQIDAGMI
jgi:hypothetical protein